MARGMPHPKVETWLPIRPVRRLVGLVALSLVAKVLEEPDLDLRWFALTYRSAASAEVARLRP